VIRDAAAKGPCVIVGRCGDYVLRDMPGVLRVFVHADENFCVEKVTELYNVDRKEALEMIHRIDKRRAEYYKYFTGRDWYNASNYDLCLNSSELGFEKCVEIIRAYMEIRMK